MDHTIFGTETSYMSRVCFTTPSMMGKQPMNNMHIHMYFVGQIHMCFVKGDVGYVSNRN